MRGSVIKRGKTWSVVYDQGKDDDGKRRQKWVSGFPTRKAAQQALAGLLADLAQGSYVEPRQMTFGVLAEEEWLPAVRGRLRATTLEGYERVSRKHVYPAIGGVQVRRLDPAQLDRLYRALSEGERRADGTFAKKPLGDGMVRHVAAVISSCLKWAKKKRLVAVNVATLADLPSTGKKPRRRVWTAEQVRTFLDSTADDRLAAMWRFLALTGCRRGEALGLTWFALDLDGGTVRIERQLVPLAGRLEFSPPKSDAAIRTLPLDAGTVAMLKKHRDVQDIEKAAWGDAYSDGGLVFCKEDGTPLRPTTVSQWFQLRRKAADLPTLNLHGLRHSAATHLALTVGAHPETTRAQLGHSSVRTTADVYTHALPDASRRAADALASAFDDPR